MNNSKGDIEKLEGTVESTIETLRQIGIIIEDFKDESQEQLFKKMYSLFPFKLFNITLHE